MGNEQPFEGRMRLYTEGRYRTETFGSVNVNHSKLTEYQFLLAASYTPIEPVTLFLSVPILWKDLEKANGAVDQATGLGDIVLQSKITLLKGESDGGRDLFGVNVGSRFPTAIQQKNGGVPIDMDAQLGTGSFVPQFGLWYSRFRYPLFWYASTTAQIATEGWEMTPGETVLVDLVGQYQFTTKFGLQLGVDSRWSAKDSSAGVSDPNSGGFFTFLSPSLVFSPIEDLVANVSIQIPVIDELNGDHGAGVTIFGGISYDL